VQLVKDGFAVKRLKTENSYGTKKAGWRKSYKVSILQKNISLVKFQVKRNSLSCTSRRFLQELIEAEVEKAAHPEKP
jgi:hypothetical protein